MLALHAAVRPTLVRAITVLLLVVVALSSYSPVATAKPDPWSISRYEPAPSAALEVSVVRGIPFIPAPIADALVTVHDASSGNKVTFGYTNADARVDFRLAPGTYMVAVEAESHGSFTSEQFTLESNESHFLMIFLSPTP